MTDPRELMTQYLAQRRKMGETAYMGITVSHHLDEQPASLSPSSPARAVGDRPDEPTTEVADEPKWKRGAPPIPPSGIVVPTPATDLFTGDPLAKHDLDQLGNLIRKCTKCVLCEHRKQAVPGEGPMNARLVVVGEGPGATEDDTGRPFVGRAGELLTDILKAIGIPRETVFICNIVKCRPPNNRKPLQDEIDACVPYLYRQLENIKPAVILAMGGTAAETLLGTKQSLGSLRNKVHEFRGTPLIVTYHPAALLRNPNWKKPTWDDVRIVRQLLDQRD